MGVIQRQGIKNAITSYIGIALGFLNLLVIQPYFLSAEEIGLTRLLFSVASLLAMFMPLGIQSITVKYFPYFYNPQNRHNGFLGFALLFPIVGFLIVSTLLLVAKDFIVSQYAKESALFTQFYYFLFPFSFIIALVTVLTAYASALLKTTVPSFLNDVFTRIGSIAIFALYFLKWITLWQMVAGFVTIYGMQLVLLLCYIYWEEKPSYRFSKKMLQQHPIGGMLGYGLLLSFASISALGIKYIDSIVLGKYLSLSMVGIYSIASFIPNIIETPLNALDRITGPKIAQSIAAGNASETKAIYYQSSKYCLLVGAYLFIGINTNIKDVFSFLPSQYAQGIDVIHIISLGTVLSMSAGGSGGMLFYSNNYKIGAFFLIALALSAFVFNMLFIPIWGLNGAAYATALASVLYAVIRLVFIKAKYNLFPLTIDTIKLVGLSVLVYLLTWLLPNTDSPLLTIVVKGFTTTVCYALGIYWLKLAPELFERLLVFRKNIIQ